jgi:hypothetical protein
MHGLLPVRAPFPGVDYAGGTSSKGPKKLANSGTEWLYTRTAPATIAMLAGPDSGQDVDNATPDLGSGRLLTRHGLAGQVVAGRAAGEVASQDLHGMRGPGRRAGAGAVHQAIPVNRPGARDHAP